MTKEEFVPLLRNIGVDPVDDVYYDSTDALIEDDDKDVPLLEEQKPAENVNDNSFWTRANFYRAFKDTKSKVWFIGFLALTVGIVGSTGKSICEWVWDKLKNFNFGSFLFLFAWSIELLTYAVVVVTVYRCIKDRTVYIVWPSFLLSILWILAMVAEWLRQFAPVVSKIKT